MSVKRITLLITLLAMLVIVFLFYVSTHQNICERFSTSTPYTYEYDEQPISKEELLKIRERKTKYDYHLQKDKELNGKIEIKFVNYYIGLGVFAKVEFLRGDFILYYVHNARRYRLSERKQLPKSAFLHDQIVRVADEYYCVTNENYYVGGLINHSCDANAYLDFSSVYPHIVKVIARRNIRLGTEITIDYRLFSSSEDKFDYGNKATFKCRCGAKDCTGIIPFQSLSKAKRIQFLNEGIIPFFVVNDYIKDDEDIDE